MLKAVVEGLKLVAAGVESVTSIAEAVKSGTAYLKARHPEVRSDLGAMVEELGKSLFVIKRASAVLTNFHFAVLHDARGSELARFNDYFIQSKTEAHFLRSHIDELRTHCSKIRDHGLKIGRDAQGSWFVQVFVLLGLRSAVREQELGEKLDRLAGEDFAVANSAEKMLECLERALKDVQDALGGAGTMDPERVPDAAALLAEYGPAFEKMEAQAWEAVKAIRHSVHALSS